MNILFFNLPIKIWLNVLNFYQTSIILTMQENKVITQADQALQGQANVPGRRASFQLQIDIRNSGKQVQSLICRFHNYRRPSQQRMRSQINDRNISMNWASPFEQKQKDNILKKSSMQIASGRFNYYGKYRFEQRQKELQIEQPSFRNHNKTVNFFPPQIEQAPSILTQPKYKHKQESMIANNSIFEDKVQIKYPNKSYYVFFDKQTKGKNLVVNEKSHPLREDKQKHKPNWILERKIKALQKQVKQLRQHSQTQKDFMRKTDQPIRLKKGVQRMIETLWP